MRQLQTRTTDYVAYAEWNGDAPGPLPPDATHVFVDVTNQPGAQLGNIYNPAAHTWTSHSEPQIRRLSKLALLSLLTPEEYQAVFLTEDAALQFGVAQFQAAPDPFSIDDPRVQAMLLHIVTSGAFTTDRKDALWMAMQNASSET